AARRRQGRGPRPVARVRQGGVLLRPAADEPRRDHAGRLGTAVDMPLTDSPLLRLLRRGSDRFGTGLLGVTVLSGLASALLLRIINAAAANAASEAANGQYLAYFAIVIVLYVVTQRHILMTSIVEVERILHGIRTRLTERIRHA